MSLLLQIGQAFGAPARNVGDKHVGPEVIGVVVK
jgi:hypothetical protein